MNAPRRTVELRIHGVSGTPPEIMLDDPHPVQISGDETGRIFRRRSPWPGVSPETDRVVEGYHWGRYTSGSASRALWLLLLPFAVLNLARFALLLREQPTWLRYLADAVVRLLGLVLTLALIVTTCYVAWEVAARQCMSQATCTGLPGWAAWYSRSEYGTRLIVAAIAPTLVVALLWMFGRRPPGYEPPGGILLPPEDSDQLGDPAFWQGALTASRQRAAHVWGSCSVIGMLALATLRRRDDWKGELPNWANALQVTLIASCALTGAAAVLVVAIDRQPWLRPRRLPSWLDNSAVRWLFAGDELVPDPVRRDAIRIPRWQVLTRWYAAAVAAACVIFAALTLNIIEQRNPAGNWRFELAVALVGAAAGLLLLLLGVLTCYMAWTPAGRKARSLNADDELAVPRPFRPVYQGMGAWVLASLAVTLGFGFSSAIVFWIANFLGTPVRPDESARGDAIVLAAGYWTSATVWGAMAALLAALALPLAAWTLRRRWAAVLGLVALSALVVVISPALVPGGRVIAGLFAVALLMGAVRMVLAPGNDGFPAIAGNDYDSAEADDGRIVPVVASWRFAMMRYRYHHVLAVIAVAGGVAAFGWGLHTGYVLIFTQHVFAAPKSDPLATIGVAAATAFAAGLLTLGVASWRQTKIRILVGILWDMISFWPRVGHPLCPVPYGGRAVRAVVQRTVELAREPLDVDPLPDPRDAERAPGRFSSVVVSGHSQGSVIAVAACALLSRLATAPDEAPSWVTQSDACEAMQRTYLLTYGSQLQFIFARLFPAYLGFRELEELYKGIDGRWRNLYRWTDPLGGPVLSWPLQEKGARVGRFGPRPTQRYGPSVKRWTTMADTVSADTQEAARLEEVDGVDIEPATVASRLGKSEYRRWNTGPDVRLVDPGLIDERPLQPRRAPRGHSGYFEDPGFDAVLAELLRVSGRPQA